MKQRPHTNDRADQEQQRGRERFPARRRVVLDHLVQGGNVKADEKRREHRSEHRQSIRLCPHGDASQEIVVGFCHSRARNGDLMTARLQPTTMVRGSGLMALVETADRTELLTAGAEAVIAYDPDTGQELYRTDGTRSHPIPELCRRSRSATRSWSRARTATPSCCALARCTPS